MSLAPHPREPGTEPPGFGLASLPFSKVGPLGLLLMFGVFIYASAAATLGGFDSPGGAVLGGLIIGVIENLAAGYAP